ncbi:ribosome silencing factor [soil metagenome]
METLAVLANRKKSSVTRLTKNSKIYKAIIAAIQQRKGEQVISLDLRKIPEAVADFFVICQATSSTQVKSIADAIEEAVKKNCGQMPYKHEGQHAAQWILIDYVDIVVHIMQPDTRKFYKLEELWSDGVLTAHDDE